MIRQLFARDPAPPQPVLSAEIHLQNDLVVVHPTPPEASEDGLPLPRTALDDSLLSGSVIIVSDSDVLLWNIRIALVIYCKYRRPGEETWQQGIIYEQSRVFNHLDREARICTSLDRRTIHRQIDFALMVPSHVPTHEYLKMGIIIPQVRVSVEHSRNTWSETALAALPTLPPVYVNEREGGRTIAGRQMRTQSHSGHGDVKLPPPDPTDIVITHGSSTLGVPQHPVQTWIKNFAVIANANPTTAGTPRLRSHKRGVSAGAGEWDIYWWSDVYSVGGYVSPRIEFKHMSPQCTIFGIHVCILQTYTITPIETFRSSSSSDPDDQATKYIYPTETFVLQKDGQVPSFKRPSVTGNVLFNAAQHLPKSGSGGGGNGVTFTWEPGRIRLHDDHVMRPSVFPGTKTPFEIRHELSLRVFFSVVGETLHGTPIEGDGGTTAAGEMRMLVINLAERVASVCLTFSSPCEPLFHTRTAD
ncbi:hypothetical protein QFC19_002877 [Naganishia cerealis]|uniref:Uncharacterized protein n=1 Tax=Naganishia cerealis TaxID=610337 RepID=A0ACC2W728_9TREE|nr:hypothetical protein QFC19_002877 [Naganishia cerealis]